MDRKADERSEGISRRDFLLRAGSTALVIGTPASLLTHDNAALAVPGRGPKTLEPIKLDPENPHYFFFRGRTTALVTSTEHYGSVLNLDFDYRSYLNELKRRGLNLTRIFSGVYRVVPDYLKPRGLPETPLGPHKLRYVAPWARSSEPGYAHGGNKFDLTTWDPAYFERLKDFVAMAGRRGIIVEMTLFCRMYGDFQWSLSPMNARNNVNGIGDVDNDNVYRLDNQRLLAVQEAMTRKIVTELNEFDNVYFEVINEGYEFVSQDWENHIAETIAATEENLPKTHLIAQNIANGSKQIVDPHPAISVFNFHYAGPPAVAENYHFDRPIADDETGFDGSDDVAYRMQGWKFMMAGGAVFDNLDFSFTIYDERGAHTLPDEDAITGGSPELRDQLGFLNRFMQRLPLREVAPDNAVTVTSPDTANAWSLAAPGKVRAVYVADTSNAYSVTLSIEAPAGRYQAKWFDPVSGHPVRVENVAHDGGALALESPTYETDIVLLISKRGSSR